MKLILKYHGMDDEMIEVLIIITSTIYILYLLYEYRENKKIRKRFLHVIHVNGTRGKSSVCRLIDAGLRSGGYRVFTKTTGTSPRVIDTNGKEHEIYRKGKPNIKEQIKILKMAAKQNAEILVIECMAVKPELQYISQNKILKADISVVTNVRRDHLLEMGPRLEDVAKSLGNVMPRNGIFVTADETFFNYYVDLGKHKNSKTVLVKDFGNYDIDFSENVALGLEICNLLGIDNNRALVAMKDYKYDPGRLNIHSIKTINEKKIFFINAFAANDPDSTFKIYQYIKKMDFFPNKKFIVLINNRVDRIDRMKQFIKFINSIPCDNIWIMGSFTKLMERKLIANQINNEIITIFKNWKDIDLKGIEENTIIFAIGNINGWGREMADFVEGIGESLV